MQPVLDEGLAARPLALGDFVLVVGENQILAATMDVEGLAEILHAHGRTFDMPAGPAGSPGGFPGGLAGLGRLPQGEVHRVALLLAGSDAGAGPHFVHVALGQFEVAGELLHREVDVAAGGIGHPPGDEALDDGDDLGDVLGGLGLATRQIEAESGHILVEGADEFLGQGVTVDPPLVGPVDDLVVDVGVVADVVDLVTGKPEIAVDDVEDDIGAGVADMAVVVHGHATDVHADLAGHQRLKIFLASGEGIVNTQSHEKPFLRWKPAEAAG